MEKKKKPSNYIIPATFFTALSPTPKKEPIVVKTEPKTEQKLAQKEPKKVVLNASAVIKSDERPSSAFSLKRVKEKKVVVKKKTEENYDNYPADSFTQQELTSLWKLYQSELQRKGEKSIASVLETSEPELEPDNVILFSLPNQLMKTQLKKGQNKLLKFLREKLNNYHISLDIQVDEVVEKKFAYTPKEKFEKLKEKNPLIAKLKDSFNLDL